MSDSIKKSLITGRMFGVTSSGVLGAFALSQGELAWLSPYIQDVLQVCQLDISPDTVQRWIVLVIMIWGFITPVISKAKERKNQ